MTASPRQRWLMLGSLLLAVLAAAALVDSDTEGKPEPGKKGRSTASTAASGHPDGGGRQAGSAVPAEPLPALSLALPEAESAAEATNEPGVPVIDPFRSKTWYIAPPPPPPPKPTAPLLPFQYLGKLSEGGEIQVFLSHQGKYLIARVGDVINGTYLVEEIAGGRMTFLYQPLKEKQMLAIGSE